jgi:IS605 OrfB family transposase
MFKTARFKVHNPSRHKRTMLEYALRHYHLTLKSVLESVLSNPDLESQIASTDKKGRKRFNGYAISKLLYRLAPKGWALSPLRDYLITDATAMLLSHFKKLEKGKNKSNPPTLPSLDPMTPEEYRRAYEDFCAAHEFPIKPQQQEKIDKARAEGKKRVAARLERIYGNWAASRAAGLLLRRLEGAVPRPIEFTRPELERGFALLRRGNNYFVGLKLFGSKHRYCEQKVLSTGFVDWRTGESLDGKKFTGLLVPLELGREFHESEYLQQGKPQSAKLVAKRLDNGVTDFYVHVAFEFNPTSIQPETVLGIDRGAAKIGAASIIDQQGKTVQTGVDLEGQSFSKEMARWRARIAELQRKGLQRHRAFKLRGRIAEIIIGEYANRLVEMAREHRSQIAIEDIKGTSMARFLTQSQFSKLRDKLAYKAERVGLPKPIGVPAAYTSQTCARCGHKAPENRPKRDAQGHRIQDQFLCVQCGHSANADDNASEVIALRALHQRLKGGKFQKFPAFQQWLQSLGRDRPVAQAAGV